MRNGAEPVRCAAKIKSKAGTAAIRETDRFPRLGPCRPVVSGYLFRYSALLGVVPVYADQRAALTTADAVPPPHADDSFGRRAAGAGGGMALVQAIHSGRLYLAGMRINRSGYLVCRPSRRGASMGDSEARGLADSRSAAANPVGEGVST